MLTSRLALVSKNLIKTAIRRSGDHHGPTYRGQNLPFDITNHRLFAIKMTIFLAVPFAIPFLLVRYHLLKASGYYG